MYDGMLAFDRAWTLLSRPTTDLISECLTGLILGAESLSTCRANHLAFCHFLILLVLVLMLTGSSEGCLLRLTSATEPHESNFRGVNPCSSVLQQHAGLSIGV
jgi:hypothetical protein